MTPNDDESKTRFRYLVITQQRIPKLKHVVK